MRIAFVYCSDPLINCLQDAGLTEKTHFCQWTCGECDWQERQSSTVLFMPSFTFAGVKDIILPGDFKEIMNLVLIAERKAQANLITRREEIASTRSLLNTARLMDERLTLKIVYRSVEIISNQHSRSVKKKFDSAHRCWSELPELVFDSRDPLDLKIV